MKRLLAFSVVLLPACGGVTEEQLWPRAAFDMQCPEQNLRVFKIDDEVRGVTGCGQQRTYVAICSHHPGALGRSCNWVANSAAVQQPAYPASPGPYLQGAPPPGVNAAPAPPAGPPAPYPWPAPTAPKSPDAGGGASAGR